MAQVELMTLLNGMKKILNVEDANDIGDQLKNAVLNARFQVFDDYCALVGDDLKTDYLQKIYQYYFADRRGLKQDFTPKTMAALLGEYARRCGADVVEDLCSGSGALAIQVGYQDFVKETVCHELNDGVLPYLLFNLAVRNLNSIVYHEDLLSGEIKAVYELKQGEKYASCSLKPAV